MKSHSGIKLIMTESMQVLEHAASSRLDAYQSADHRILGLLSNWHLLSNPLHDMDLASGQVGCICCLNGIRVHFRVWVNASDAQVL